MVVRVSRPARWMGTSPPYGRHMAQRDALVDARCASAPHGLVRRAADVVCVFQASHLRAPPGPHTTALLSATRPSQPTSALKTPSGRKRVFSNHPLCMVGARGFCVRECCGDRIQLQPAGTSAGYGAADFCIHFMAWWGKWGGRQTCCKGDRVVHCLKSSIQSAMTGMHISTRATMYVLIWCMGVELVLQHTSVSISLEPLPIARTSSGSLTARHSAITDLS